MKQTHFIRPRKRQTDWTRKHRFLATAIAIILLILLLLIYFLLPNRLA